MLHKTNIYKFRANSKKAQQVNPSPFKSAQVPWTYFSAFAMIGRADIEGSKSNVAMNVVQITVHVQFTT